MKLYTLNEEYVAKPTVEQLSGLIDHVAKLYDLDVEHRRLIHHTRQGGFDNIFFIDEKKNKPQDPADDWEDEFLDESSISLARVDYTQHAGLSMSGRDGKTTIFFFHDNDEGAGGDDWEWVKFSSYEFQRRLAHHIEANLPISEDKSYGEVDGTLWGDPKNFLDLEKKLNGVLKKHGLDRLFYVTNDANQELSIWRRPKGGVDPADDWEDSFTNEPIIFFQTHDYDGHIIFWTDKGMSGYWDYIGDESDDEIVSHLKRYHL